MVTDCKLSLEERLGLGARLHSEGYNCAQCVLGTFGDHTGLTPDESARIAIGLGGGVGGCGGTCGVVTAMAIAVGLMSAGKPADKAPVYAEVRRLNEEFETGFGSLLCRELKCPGARHTCPQLIAGGIQLLHNHLCRKE